MRRLYLKRRRFFPFILIFLFSLFFILMILVLSFSPAFFSLAKSGGENFARALFYNELSAISESFDFSDMANITKENGKITEISMNYKKANLLSSLFSQRVNTLLSDKEYASFHIPLGNLTKHPLLSGRGPKIPIRIVPMGSIVTNIKSEFSEAGINQTKYLLYIDASFETSVLSPFSSAKCLTEIKIPLWETVIVGDVPSLYSKK